ncbi:MAG: class I SAM-dependent rRNA methyltransferase [Proteobacteria bacterium]|nr:class I SAM-dependent rRNA methyltransferase [Pseudomonadota bacterium]
MTELRLRPGRKHRVLHGHPWVFSNQLVEVPSIEPGAEVTVRAHDCSFVGRGYGHPNTLISARLLTRDEDQPVDEAFVRGAVARSFGRRSWIDRTSWRAVHGEADGLPGLVIDRFDDLAVLAANTAGMERLRPWIEAAVRDDLGIAHGLWKCDGRGRQLEGLPETVDVGWGEPAAVAAIDDDGVQVGFEVMGGQKTGLFLDMWENRRRMVRALAGPRTLDLYSYVGQWGLHMAAAGAGEVVCVDRSAGAIAQVRANAERNGWSDRVTGTEASVDEFLRTVPDASFDGVVCDPPSFIRSRKQSSQGMKAYRTLFAHALRKVRPGGHAVLASCSHHLWEDRFADVVKEAGKWAKRRLTVVMKGGQSPCHPVPLAVPEARYLKCWLVRVDTLGT